MKKDKSLFLLLLLFCGYSVAWSQTYYVVSVKGTIKNETKAKNLAVKDPVAGTDKMKFDNGTSEAVLLNPSSGRFVMRAKVSATPKPSELTAYVKDVLTPQTSNEQMSSRSKGDLITSHYADTKIAKELNGSDFLLLDSKSFSIAEAGFNHKSKPSYVIKFKVGTKTYERAISAKDTTLTFTRAEVLGSDPELSSVTKIEKIVLYHRGFNLAKKVHIDREIAGFTIHLPDPKAVVEEANMIKTIMTEGGANESKTYNAVRDHLVSQYGIVSYKDLEFCGVKIPADAGGDLKGRRP